MNVMPYPLAICYKFYSLLQEINTAIMYVIMLKHIY